MNPHAIRDHAIACNAVADILDRLRDLPEPSVTFGGGIDARSIRLAYQMRVEIFVDGFTNSVTFNTYGASVCTTLSIKDIEAVCDFVRQHVVLVSPTLS